MPRRAGRIHWQADYFVTVTAVTVTTGCRRLKLCWRHRDHYPGTGIVTVTRAFKLYPARAAGPGPTRPGLGASARVRVRHRSVRAAAFRITGSGN
jgi:hypothetical protein